MRVTIDTNILVNAFDKQEYEHLEIVLRIRRKTITICLDTPVGASKSSIENEYRNNLKKSVSFQKWYLDISKRNQLEFCNGRLDTKHVGFLKKNGCHEPSDHVFIAVACNSGKILFTEDSDLGKGVKGIQPPHCDVLQYLQKIGLTVCDASEALTLLDSIQ